MTPRPVSQLPEVMIAGAIGGVLAGLTFAVAHAFIIVPIWDRMMGGLAFGAIAGAVGAWAYFELHSAPQWTVREAVLKGAAF